MPRVSFHLPAGRSKFSKKSFSSCAREGNFTSDDVLPRFCRIRRTATTRGEGAWGSGRCGRVPWRRGTTPRRTAASRTFRRRPRTRGGERIRIRRSIRAPTKRANRPPPSPIGEVRLSSLLFKHNAIYFETKIRFRKKKMGEGGATRFELVRSSRIVGEYVFSSKRRCKVFAGGGNARQSDGRLL